MSNYRLIVGDCLEKMSELPDNSVDACITDPPYGMGMDDWDHSVPTKAIWEEVLRVLKPGGYCLSFCSPQLYHRMAVAVEDAGFTIKDQIMWMVTTKMPRKNNLKQAHEPVVVAQKPFKGSIIKNVEQWGTGKIDTDNTRVPWDGKPPKGWVKGGLQRTSFGKKSLSARKIKAAQEAFLKIGKDKFNSYLQILEPYQEYMTDENRYILQKAFKEKKKKNVEVYDFIEKEYKGRTESANPSGRYPSNIIGEVHPEHQKYFYSPRVTRKERGDYNDHPTPKPIALMSYLIRVFSPEGSTVIDPFCGSGSTGIAAVQEGRQFIGMDLSEHYIKIAEQRIKDHTGS